MYQNSVEPDWSRIIVVLIAQSILCAIYLLLGATVLKRNRDRLNKNLSAFYIIVASGFLLNIVYFFLRISPLVFYLYLITGFLLTFGNIFLVFFTINLVKFDYPLKRQIQITILYAVVLLIVFSIPDGIAIDESTNWRPVFSWTFFIAMSIVHTVFIVIPLIIYSMKTYKIFEDKTLKKKLRYFFIGVTGILILAYGTLLYNTWDNSQFRNLWTLIVLFIIPSGILIYYGIGNKL